MRLSQVAVDGALSYVIDLTNTVFQGTVLGPTLWNTFFNDVATEASSQGGREVLFADDLNTFKSYSLEVSNEDANQAAYKESLHAAKAPGGVVNPKGKKETRPPKT